MLDWSVMMIRWRGRPELNSRRDSSWSEGLVRSSICSKIPQIVMWDGGERRVSGLSK